MISRRRFTFWFSFGLFSLAEKLDVYALDELAAALMGDGGSTPMGPLPIHWRAADNALWKWYERETFIDGRWTLSGITTPVHKQTGQRYAGQSGYLDEALAPNYVRLGHNGDGARVDASGAEVEAPDEPLDDGRHDPGHPDASRRARHGRPPSKWLRSLHAEELQIWLKTISVPEADVSGMTYWEHLTRDHFFDPLKIEGLLEADQALLHAAAHYGY